MDGIPIDSNKHYNLSGYNHVNDSCSSSKLTFTVSSAFRSEQTFYCEDRQNPNRSLLPVCYNNKTSGVIVVRVVGSLSPTPGKWTNYNLLSMFITWA